MSKFDSKHDALDKYDAYFPSNKPIVHSNWYVSQRRMGFHHTRAYGWNYNGPGAIYGVNKNAWFASGKGYDVDARHIGKPDGH